MSRLYSVLNWINWRYVGTALLLSTVLAVVVTQAMNVHDLRNSNAFHSSRIATLIDVIRSSEVDRTSYLNLLLNCYQENNGSG